jgi:hypothetical protein
MTLPNSKRKGHGVKTIMRGILSNSIRHIHGGISCGGSATAQFQNDRSWQYNRHNSAEETPMPNSRSVKAIHCDMPSLNCDSIAMLEYLMVEAIQIWRRNDLYYHGHTPSFREYVQIYSFNRICSHGDKGMILSNGNYVLVSIALLWRFSLLWLDCSVSHIQK